MTPALALARVSHSWRQVGRILEESSLSLLPVESAALVAPHAGEVTVAGERPADDWTRTLLCCRRFGLVFQDHRLLPEIDTTDNAATPLLLDGVLADRARAQAVETLIQVGLGQRLRHPVGKLSSGKNQPVAIAWPSSTSPSSSSPMSPPAASTAPPDTPSSIFSSKDTRRRTPPS